MKERPRDTRRKRRGGDRKKEIRKDNISRKNHVCSTQIHMLDSIFRFFFLNTCISTLAVRSRHYISGDRHMGFKIALAFFFLHAVLAPCIYTELDSINKGSRRFFMGIVRVKDMIHGWLVKSNTTCS